MKNANKTNIFYCITGILAILILVGIDQYTKFLAVLNLKTNAINLIDNVFQLTYLENNGAAFGIMNGKKMFFIFFTIIVLILVCVVYLQIPKEKHYTLLRLVSILFASGAIGNMIDRVWHNYVIDFFYFELINFPVFNVADCYVTIAAGLLIFLFLFVYKEEELSFILQLNKKGMKKEND